MTCATAETADRRLLKFLVYYKVTLSALLHTSMVRMALFYVFVRLNISQIDFELVVTGRHWAVIVPDPSLDFSQLTDIHTLLLSNCFWLFAGEPSTLGDRV